MGTLLDLNGQVCWWYSLTRLLKITHWSGELMILIGMTAGLMAPGARTFLQTSQQLGGGWAFQRLMMSIYVQLKTSPYKLLRNIDISTAHFIFSIGCAGKTLLENSWDYVAWIIIVVSLNHFICLGVLPHVRIKTFWDETREESETECAAKVQHTWGLVLSSGYSSVAEHWLHMLGVLGSIPSNCWAFYLSLFLPQNI